ncbi:MAG TPA: hypothetical protein VN730_03435 [Steroidobacteraceae bacterium]|nr:hypothetical protein [Steroidobacteraceae bacterium]
MAIEHVRICGACERECPGWANRCPACGSLSLLYRITFVPVAAVVPEAARATQSEAELRAASSGERGAKEYVAAAGKVPHKGIAHPRIAAARDAKLRKTPLGGKPETRAV